MRKVIRQGDVLLVAGAKLPAGAKLVPLDRGRIVLAYGEVTGHAHAIRVVDKQARADEMTEALMARLKARLYEAEGERFLVIEEPVALQHEEHEPVKLAPGIYEVPMQMEYDATLMRRVAD